MIKLLNITPHVGGGVGNVIKELTNNLLVSQTIICLDEIKNNNINSTIIFDDMINHISDILDMIKDSDIVLLHYWNHPLLYKFLLENDIPECRLIVWSHTLGIYHPYNIHKDIVDMSSIFVLASEASYESPVIKNTFDKDKIKVIRSTGGIEQFNNLKRIEHEGINILYVGTLDYSKLHRNFVNMCLSINRENVKFILCGEMSDEVLNDINNCSHPEKFIIKGKIDNIKEQLQIADIFGYPLSDKNYSTGELVLGEAMIAGIVPVVIDNLPESYIVQNNYNGLIVSESEYSNAVMKLIDDIDLRNRLSTNAIESAKEIYSTKKMINGWKSLIYDIMFCNKKNIILNYNTNCIDGFNIFAYSLDDLQNLFLNYDEEKIIDLFKSSDQWNSLNKGSVRQYLSYFPDDTNLKELVRLLDNIT